MGKRGSFVLSFPVPETEGYEQMSSPDQEGIRDSLEDPSPPTETPTPNRQSPVGVSSSGSSPECPMSVLPTLTSAI